MKNRMHERKEAIDLQILAISDTHVGEDSSILTFPQGRQLLWQTLREFFGGPRENPTDTYNGKFNIDELILLGDIPDTALSSRSQIITHTNALIQMLGSAANVGKGIYIPGNHDHTLWTDYREKKNEIQSCSFCTPPEGDLIVKNNHEYNFPASEDLLTIFFGYPYGASWRKIVDKEYQKKNIFNFAVVNPLYVTQNAKRTYVFTHGTHFKSAVIKRDFVKKIIRYLGIDPILIKLKDEPELIQQIPDKNELKRAQLIIENSESKPRKQIMNQNVINLIQQVTYKYGEVLHHIEENITSFVDSIWASSGNNPTSTADHLFNIFNLFRGNFEFEKPERFESELFSNSDLHTYGKNVENKIKHLTRKDKKPLELFKNYFLYPMLFYLRYNGLLNKPLTFVYGDTHNGGYGELPRKIKGKQTTLRIYNCGSWVVKAGDKHPPCHIFAVDKAGNEYLLNVSVFDQKVLGESLLKLASKDVENRTNLSIRVVDSILTHFPKFLTRWIGKIVEKMSHYISL